MARMNQQLAADIVGLTDRRLRQLGDEPNPPPRDADGWYPGPELVEWSLLRELVRNRGPAAVKLYQAARERGAGSILCRTRDEVREILGVPDDGKVQDDGLDTRRRIEPDRREVVEAFRERAAAARGKAALAKVIAEDLDDVCG